MRNIYKVQKRIVILLLITLAMCIAAGVFIHLRNAGAGVTADAYNGHIALSENADAAASGEADGGNGLNNTLEEEERLATAAGASEAAMIPLDWSSHIYYDSERTRLLTGGALLNEISKGIFFDEYQFIFEGMDWPSRRVLVYDGFVRDIVMENDVLTLRCARAVIPEHSAEGDMSYVRFTNPKELYDTVVVIDPGHGGEDFGATIDGVREKDINLDIVNRVLEGFDNPRVLLLPTRTEDEAVSLEERYRLANRVGDYFISVHNNVDASSSRTGGTITYYHNHPLDKPITSEMLAEAVQVPLVSRLATRDRGVEYTPVYRVLINTHIPAVIAEVMFLSNPEERARLSDANSRRLIAGGLLEAINALPPARRITR